MVNTPPPKQKRRNTVIPVYNRYAHKTHKNTQKQWMIPEAREMDAKNKPKNNLW